MRPTLLLGAVALWTALAGAACAAGGGPPAASSTGVEAVEEVEIAQPADPAAGAAPAERCEPHLPADRIVSTRQERIHSGSAARIWMRNHSRCTIRITTIRLTECRNIRNPCDSDIGRNVEIEPLRERIVFLVRPRSRAESWRFYWRYTWDRP